MNLKKFWYVVKDSKGVYFVGNSYGRQDVEEQETIAILQRWCMRKGYRLVLLAHILPELPLVNQIYPYEITEESRQCLSEVLEIC